MFTRFLNGREWSYQNKLSSELETAEFMRGLVRLLKPRLVVETGCYMGEMSHAIGSALRLNGYGILKTCDIDPEMTRFTFELCQELPVEVYGMNAGDMLRETPNVDLAYIDGSEFRSAEMAFLRLSPHAFVALHDANNEAYQPPAKWWRDGECNQIHFPTPLGLALYEVKRA